MFHIKCLPISCDSIFLILFCFFMLASHVGFFSCFFFFLFSRLFVLKKFLHWYFLQKIRSNDENLLELKRRKKSLLEFAMETETYKVVKELLEKFDPEYHRRVRNFCIFFLQYIFFSNFHNVCVFFRGFLFVRFFLILRIFFFLF